MPHSKIVRIPLILMGICVLLLLAGCSAGEPVIAEASQEELIIPSQVLQARDAVLDFLHEAAYGMMPSPSVEWAASKGGEGMPDGFGIYFFNVDSSIMSVTYVLPATEETLYHVSYGDSVTGVCWQALADSHGRLVKTGSDAELGADANNASYIYCTDHGYTYEVQQQDSGGLCGVCVFPDESTCKGWAFLRGQCKEGDSLTGD